VTHIFLAFNVWIDTMTETIKKIKLIVNLVTVHHLENIALTLQCLAVSELKERPVTQFNNKGPMRENIQSGTLTS